MSTQDVNRILWIRKQAAEQQELFKNPLWRRAEAPKQVSLPPLTKVVEKASVEPTLADALAELQKMNLPEGATGSVKQAPGGGVMKEIKIAPPKSVTSAEFEAFRKTPEFQKEWELTKATTKGGLEYGPKELLKHRIGRAALRVGAVGLGLGALAGGTALGKHFYDKIMGPVEFRKDFTAMLDQDKTLKQYDRDQMESRFRTLRKFNPEMSKDPFVASSFIRQTMELPIVTPGTIVELTRARADMKKAKSSEGSKTLTGIARMFALD